MNIFQTHDRSRAPGALTLLVCGPVFSGHGYAAERTGWGTSKLEGVWDFRTITPLERPAEFADKSVLSVAWWDSMATATEHISSGTLR